jgi:hypothetical protein
MEMPVVDQSHEVPMRQARHSDNSHNPFHLLLLNQLQNRIDCLSDFRKRDKRGSLEENKPLTKRQLLAQKGLKAILGRRTLMIIYTTRALNLESRI